MQEMEGRRANELDGLNGLNDLNNETHEGLIHISEDVIVELARKTILGIPHIQLANTRLAAKFGLGRKAADGIKISVEKPVKSGSNADPDDKIPCITIDAYVLVRYGKRIPDLAWDVQEKVKGNLERYTGYIVKAVNINVQGIYTDEPIQLEESQTQDKEKSEKLEETEVEAEVTEPQS